jgi:hypothetical protein
MTLRRSKHVDDPNAGFDGREMVCDSEDAAKAEAERQQALEVGDDAEWIYLRPEKTGQWVARRTPRELETKESLWELLLRNPLPGPGP